MIALLYDIHGNLPALEAVLADAREQGADEWIVGGDLAVFGGWPAETIGRLRELSDARWLRGNVERWCADPEDAPEPMRHAMPVYRDILGDALVRELAALPMSIDLENGTRCWHASPQSDVLSFWPEPADDEAELLEGVTDRRLIFGHTHVPFRRTAANGVELVNPGSVGMPLDGDHRAAYALLDAERDAIEHRRVAYDHTASLQAVRDRYEGEWAEIVAGRLENARF
jgi:predicted phosphodiesterase